MTEEQAKSSQPESMENILKSIKNIISGDGDKGNKEGKMAKNSKPAVNEDVLELTERIDESPATKQEAPAITPQPETRAEKQVNEEPTIITGPKASFTDNKKDVLKDIDAALGGPANNSRASEPAPAPSSKEVFATKAEPAPAKRETGAPLNPELVSEQAANSTRESLKNLMESFPKPNIQSPPLRSGSTVEDLVVESLKPMMAEWLNQNLPIIVKQIVEREVKKLIPKD